jgi:hypothetical protein
VQELRHHEVGDLIVHRVPQEDDAVVQQARKQVVFAIAARGALDDGGDEGHDGSLAAGARAPAARAIQPLTVAMPPAS